MSSDKPAETGNVPFGSAPLAGAMSNAMEQARAAADDFTRMFASMRLPAMPDSEALIGAHKRNMEALTRANQAAMEGAQAVAKRHLEIMQQTMAELGETMRTLSAADVPPQAKAARQAELLKRAYERAVANTRELSELIQHANGEALAVLNQRFTEAMEEVKALMRQGADKTG